MTTEKSKELFEKALRLMPGGVNSPVRAFRSVGGDPLFIRKAKDAFLYDQDGNKYLDLINSWGPMILGHDHPSIREAVEMAARDSLSFGAPGEKEVLIAEMIISMVPSIEKVRMVNSGTEATMSAIRLARGYTGRTKFIKFTGCYHGHGDSFLIAAGSGAATLGVPDSPGVTEGTAQDTLNATYNDLSSVQELFDRFPGEIAAVIVEPVAGNMGCVPPEEGFLGGLREICNNQNALLIFDEVMTGFRLAPGGAQELYETVPDLTTLGKIIGGGMPVGAYGGRADIMDQVAPAGPVYQAGTLSGNPVSMAAGIAMLRQLTEREDLYTQLDHTTRSMVDITTDTLSKNGIDHTINQVGSMFSVFFGKKQVRNFDDAMATDKNKFSLYFRKMLENGVYLPPSPFESAFISASIGTDELEIYKNAVELASVAISELQ